LRYRPVLAIFAKYLLQILEIHEYSCGFAPCFSQKSAAPPSAIFNRQSNNKIIIGISKIFNNICNIISQQENIQSVLPPFARQPNSEKE